ncbi:hypothetical protein FMN63_12075 [Stappia sp. BW2]|uniref:hypothetical protein n=1 Tax=Stappia sp. BW2 TaxID=2592622 RepID=UPI0011DEC38C|nr:hypothetical protein [Stappia sp. BW2]TYC66855.1 hypothetical protein FMN63_12075 [Stappia sp. BW2]
MARPLVEDAVELQVMAKNAYREIREVDLREAADEAVSYYVATLRMPSLLFERLADQLDDVNDRLEQRTQAGHSSRTGLPTDQDRPVPVRSGPHPRPGEGHLVSISI